MKQDPTFNCAQLAYGRINGTPAISLLFMRQILWGIAKLSELI